MAASVPTPSSVPTPGVSVSISNLEELRQYNAKLRGKLQDVEKEVKQLNTLFNNKLEWVGNKCQVWRRTLCGVWGAVHTSAA